MALYPVTVMVEQSVFYYVEAESREAALRDAHEIGAALPRGIEWQTDDEIISVAHLPEPHPEQGELVWTGGPDARWEDVWPS